MPDSRLVAIVTALSLLGSTMGANAAFTIQQLQEIERMISTKDCGALRQFIDSNPTLARGSDPLAAELRNFANRVDNGLIDCLGSDDRNAGFVPRKRDTDGVTRSFSDREIY